MRNLYTEEEIILCTYIARFGRYELMEEDVVQITGRSLDSIKMKVQNIAYMLEDKEYKTSDQISKLSGMPTGKRGRKTNWSIVKVYARLPQDKHREKCRDIIEK